MAKQIKIGLDKVPSPVTKQFTQLVDIEGTKLFDAAGNPLVTEEDAVIPQFANSENALSVFANNTARELGVIPVVEQFPETSNVSSSLLGVPRAEEQLSLFSDVASYGLDEDAWNAYTFSDATVPYQWYQKKHPIYGRRTNPEFREGSKEQALYLRTFPSQYSYPQGPRLLNDSVPTEAFKDYMGFIALGRFLYNEFVQMGFQEFADQNFLSATDASIIDSGDPSVILSNPDKLSIIELTQLITWNNNEIFFDVDYGHDDIQDSFDAIERWTFFWEQIRGDSAVYPVNPSYGQFTERGYYRKLVSYATGSITPGGGSTRFQVATLESKRAFRYQPGRASGFTFGSRMTADPVSQATVCEWGCANSTDQYMFQLKGTQFNIVRRSTIPMPDELLTRQGLSIDDQTDEAIYTNDLSNEIPVFETIIPRNKWNGDALLGIGDSGYILSFEDVTMYKIEFSWYGAIGAKFYAYIPSGNGDARWVLLHTFVIENGMGEPVLQNPDFKFKYTIYSTNTATITSPVQLFKYGSSYYIDGGDEGTQRLSTVATDAKAFNERTPILGLLPKNNILNSKGYPILNTRKSYPTKVSINTDKDCRIDLMEVKGCKDGVHFNYSPSLHMNGRHPRTRDLTFRFDLGDTIIRIVQPANPQITGTVFIDVGYKILTGVNTQFQTELQVGDCLYIGSDLVTVHKIAKINSQTEIELAENYTNDANANIASPGVVASVVQKINEEDNGSRIIADGIYGIYVDNSVTNGRSSPILRRSDPSPRDFSLRTGIPIRDSLKVDGSKLDRSLNFSGKLVNLHTIVGSDTPIVSDRFKIHWLNPDYKDGDYGNKHFAEFGVSVTPHKPTAPDGTDNVDRLHFQVGPETDNIFKEFERNEFPLLVYTHDRIRFDEKEQAELYEWHGAYGRGRFEVDPRNSIPKGASVQSGFISSIEGSVDVRSYQVLITLEDPISIDGPQYSGMKRMIFATSNTPSSTDIKFKTLDSSGNPVPSSGISEIGSNFVGTNFFFKSPVITNVASGERYVYVDSGITTNSDDILDNSVANLGDTISTDNGDVKVIQTKILTLKDDFQAQAYEKGADGTRIEKFPNHKFEVTQAMAFNDQPLYPVFALSDNARINGVVIEEIFPDGQRICHTPTFQTDDSNYNPHINIDTVIPVADRSLNGHSGKSSATSTATPCSFNESERLSAVRYDTSCLNPLRAGTTINSFFVEAGEPLQIDISNIFAQDRKGLSVGLLNEQALFFTATHLDDTTADGNIELALTVKEQ